MYFSNKLEEEEYVILEATKLDNNILLEKQFLDENQHYVVKLKENQCAILFEKGQIYDIIKEEGMYSIHLGPNMSFPEDLLDYQVKKNQDKLCVIFLNQNLITNNKFYIPKKYKNNFFGEGEFEFQIVNPVKLFNKVIEVRSFYSREELLEQVRERISKIATEVIKRQENEYFINEEISVSSRNVLNEYGIRIMGADIKNIHFKKKM